jgi:DNA-binding NarL/FixJ family response regulator
VCRFRFRVRGGVGGCAVGGCESNAEISRELYMSIATVKAYVSRLLEKLDYNNRVQIALLAHDAGDA